MKTENMIFNGHTGLPLVGSLDKPSGKPTATALFAHCFTCSKDIPATKRISARLTAQGIAVFRFDFTGLGQSEGDFSDTNFSSNVQDLILAAEHLASIGMAPALLIGHSLGGAAVIKAAGYIDSIKAVVTIGAPADPHHVSENFADKVEEIEAAGSAEVKLAGRPFVIKRDFLEDIRSNDLTESLKKLNRALLVLHAPLDRTVGIENAARIFMAAKHPKSFITLDDADHLITRVKDAEYAADVIATWITRYVPVKIDQPASDKPEDVVRVVESDAGGFLQDVFAGSKHHVKADEPVSAGGAGMGLTPFEFVSAGLGACTSMTLRIYASKKGWEVKQISVDVTHEKVDQGEGAKPTDLFKRKIRLEGNLTAEQRESMLQIANKCPVHRTLHGQVDIATELV